MGGGAERFLLLLTPILPKGAPHFIPGPGSVRLRALRFERALGGVVKGQPCVWAESNELGVRVAGLMAGPPRDLDLEVFLICSTVRLQHSF